MGKVDQDTAIATAHVMRRLGPEATRDLHTLLECPQDRRLEAIAGARDRDGLWATIAEIASHLHRDEPMLRRFLRALRQADG